VIRQAIIGSNTLQFYDEKYKPLTFKEFFALATLGGAQLVSLDDKIGNFKPGNFKKSVYVNYSRQKIRRFVGEPVQERWAIGYYC
jgi:cytosine/adenosine deaminase-related metal-dependent hydrolase